MDSTSGALIITKDPADQLLKRSHKQMQTLNAANRQLAFPITDILNAAVDGVDLMRSQLFSDVKNVSAVALRPLQA